MKEATVAWCEFVNKQQDKVDSHNLVEFVLAVQRHLIYLLI